MGFGDVAPADDAAISAARIAFCHRFRSLHTVGPICRWVNDCYIAILFELQGRRSVARSQFIVAAGKFDGDAFFAAIDSQRSSRKLTWKKVAEQAQVPASTLTRMSQGRRPDVDSLAALCEWSGLKVEDFTRGKTSTTAHAEPLAQITAHLRADPNLSVESARMLETLIKTAYEQFRKS